MIATDWCPVKSAFRAELDNRDSTAAGSSARCVLKYLVRLQDPEPTFFRTRARVSWAARDRGVFILHVDYICAWNQSPENEQTKKRRKKCFELFSREKKFKVRQAKYWITMFSKQTAVFVKPILALSRANRNPSAFAARAARGKRITVSIWLSISLSLSLSLSRLISFTHHRCQWNKLAATAAATAAGRAAKFLNFQFLRVWNRW